jgi:hypothetical protein
MGISHTEVLSVIDDLLSGHLTREEASLWAGPRHVEESPDPAVVEALDALTLIDARHFVQDGDYLYDYSRIVQVREALLR